MANNDFKRFMTPDFQASAQPALDWMPWEDNQQQGMDIGNILGQLKPKPAAGGMVKVGAMPGVEGKNMLSGAGGKGSL